MSYYEELTSRTALLLGDDAVKKLSDIKIIIFGVGGVGSWCAEALIRSGICNLTVVDSDVICSTNINRQIQATSQSIGKIKVYEIASRLKTINPNAQIDAINKPFTKDNHGQFNLNDYDYIVDAIDSVSNKIFLIEKALSLNIKIVSSMGAAAKIDTSKIKIANLSKTTNCSLAKIVRRGLRADKFSTDLVCVYSSELPLKSKNVDSIETNTDDYRKEINDSGEVALDWSKQKKQINGTVVYITSVFGMMLAGAIINDAVGFITFENILKS